MSGEQSSIRLAVNKSYIEDLQKRLHLSSSADVTRAALTLLDWASKEVAHDRVILSTEQDGNNVHRLVMTELAHVGKA